MNIRLLHWKKALSVSLFVLLIIAGTMNMNAQEFNRVSRDALIQSDQQQVLSRDNGDNTRQVVNSSPRTMRSNGELDYTTYDWQSNAGAITRTIVWPDGKINFAYTMATSASYSDRGTGIGTYDAVNDQWIPSGGRVENEKTGFGSIARYGQNGIVVAAHTAMQCGIYIIDDKDNIIDNSIPVASILDNTYEPTWPNVMTSGPNRNIIHVVATAYDHVMIPGMENVNQPILYFRSQDGGMTWDIQNFILPFMDANYGLSWGSNVCYWMETTDDNCLALVVNNPWSDGMVIYSYDNGDTWERKVFYKHPNPFGTFENMFLYPRWTSCQWDSQHHLHVLYEFGGRSGEPSSTQYYFDIGGVAYWNEAMPYNENGTTQSAIPGNLIPGQPFVMDSAYLYQDVYASWWHWPEPSHEMWPEYVGYLPALTDDGEWEDPYQAVSFNIDDLTKHGNYSSGVCAFPILCKVPDTDDLIAVWCAMDENNTDDNDNYYYKLFASYSYDGGNHWTDMVHLTNSSYFQSKECVYPQATVVNNRLVIACQMDGATGTYVQSDDIDAYDNYYQGLTFDLGELFGLFPIIATSNPTGGGIITGVGTYALGTVCTMTAVANSGYIFLNWTENDEVVSTDAQYSFTVTSNRNLVANFLQVEFEITVMANPAEGGMVSGAGIYEQGETCTLTSIPNEGYVFVNWMEDGQEVSTDASYSFIVTESRTLVARFVDPIDIVHALYYPDNTNIGSPYVMVDWGTNPFESQIGDGTGTTGYFPFYTYFNYSISESLFLSTELETAGMTTSPLISLSWYATNAPGYAQQGITIWMANVTDETLTTTSHVVTDMTKVYTGAITPTIGWNEFIFNEDNFAWDGHSNILIYCQRNNGVWNSTVNWQATTNLPFNAMAYKYQDSAPYDPTIANPMITSTTRPNIRFKNFDDETLYYYNVYRTDCDSNNYSLIADSVSGSMYVDSLWLHLPLGSYQYGVSFIKDDGSESGIVASNCIERILYTYQIVATINHEGRGTVSGAGEYALGATCTLTATPIGNNTFTCWKENGTVVSTETNYSFTVSGPRNLVAVFSVSPDDIIVFADNNVKALCVNNWDIDGDGELAYDEAAAVTSLDNVFSYQQSITTFDELQYFTGLTSIQNNAFTECSNLISIVIPEGITAIGQAAFYDCYNLLSVNIPEGLVSLGENAFYVCGLRGELTLPESLEWVGGYAFFGCDGISKVNYNAINCQTMGSAANPVFYDCAFTHLNIGANVQSIPNFAFKRCFMITDMIVAAVNPPTIYPGTFGMVSRSIPVSVPHGSGDVYSSTQYWEEFFNIIEVYFNDVQTVPLAEGWNWFSSNLDITLDDLKTALVAALPGTAITVKSRTQNIAYNPNTNRWMGTLNVLDVTQMYMIFVSSGCEITLEGTPIDPAEHPVTISNGTNWIAFPLGESMTVSEAFTGFAVNGDKVKSRASNTQYIGGSWRGLLNTLESGQGYMYISNSQETRTFTFSANAK